MTTAFPAPDGIVPEYRSRNPLVRWLFHQRLDIAMRLARLQGEPLHVLDIGCGEGLLLRKLHERYPAHDLTGIDHNPLVAAQEIPGLQGVAMDALRLVEDPDLFGSVNPAHI